MRNRAAHLDSLPERGRTDQEERLGSAAVADHSMLVELRDTLCDWEAAAITLWTLKRRQTDVVLGLAMIGRRKLVLTQVARQT